MKNLVITVTTTTAEDVYKRQVKDLLTMTLGQEKGFLMGKQRPRMEEQNWVKASLAIPFVYEPGTHFVYNNVGPYLAGILVQRRAGCDLLSYLTPRLLKPLGIRKTIWEVDPEGNTFGAGGLFLTVSELHKLGMFYLQNGCWNGKKLLSKEWILSLIHIYKKAIGSLFEKSLKLTLCAL